MAPNSNEVDQLDSIFVIKSTEDRTGEPSTHRNVPQATVGGRRRRPGAGGRGNH